ncbi:MAG TPA: DNA polymerase III subunit gamma/tau [Rickettsiales bacterium]|nr:DNA polymerase III subunit gamma/tau [Rickettsiales bacterium]
MEKQYQVLARKYRPQKFSELVGQPALVQTLSNEIKNDKIHHAFILTGIRGIGKTTTARLIAKSLNCSSSDKAIIDACCECEHCKSIAVSSDQDVIEFDAASHTGVDDIRQIIESTAYGPVNSRYKIFIIDEVHMLSKSAFNALLKTLEEPPAYIKFIFATTEIRKVPITILSRCQRFDLRRFSYDETKSYLANICKNEGYEIEEGALSILSNFAEGSARDALSLLDRALSHNNYEKVLSEKTVADMLGLSSKKNIYDLFISMLEGDSEKALKQFEDIYSYSLDIGALMQDLLGIAHNMIMAKTLKNFFETVHLPSDQIEIIKNTVGKVNLNSLVRVWKMLLNGENELRSNFDSKKIMDIVIINICFGSRLPSLSDIVKAQNQQTNIEKSATNNNEKSLVDNITNMFSGAKILS